MRLRPNENSPNTLVTALINAGLHASTFINDGHFYVNVHVPNAPSASTDVLCEPMPRTAGYRFISEWGDGIGPAASAADYILFLFGKASTRR